MPGITTTVASDTFDSTQYPQHKRLHKFEEHVRGGPRRLMSTTLLRPLGSDNQNIHILERLLSTDSYLSFLQSTGFVSTTDSSGFDARSDSITVGLVKNGTVEVRTEQNRFEFRAGDIYISSTANFQSTFGDGEMARLIYPSGSQKELFRRSGEFVAIRDHEPVSRLLKAALSGLEAVLRGNGVASGGQMSRLATGLASKVIEEHIFSSAISGYDIIRERAREYIHDNFASPDLNVVEIADYVGASRATMYRAFEGLGGVRAYINFVRVERAKSLLGLGQPDRGGIANIAYACGFSSPEQLRKAFKKYYGVSPTHYSGK